MSKLKSLRDIFEDKGMSYVKTLLESPIVISEKINETRFLVERLNNGDLVFFKRDGVITKFDRVSTRLYEDPINFFLDKPNELINYLKPGFRYGFRVFINESLTNSLNNLILTDIQDLSTKEFLNDITYLNEIAQSLSVSPPPILWEGELDGIQKIKILEYLRLSESVISSKIKTTFTDYVISLVDPSIIPSYINESSGNTNSLMITFLNEDGVNTKISNPIMENKINKREPQDLYGIILSDLVEFIKINGVKKYKVYEEDLDEKTISLVSKIFNDYIRRNHKKYEGLDIEPMEFASNPKFKINLDLLTNEKTKEYIKGSSINEHIFKILLSSITKPKRKVSGTLTEMLINDLKGIVKSMKSYLNEVVIKDDSLITFKEYLENKKTKSYKIKD